MNKKRKIILGIILILVIIIMAYVVYNLIFSTCCEPKPAPINSISTKDQRLADPGLIYASFWWSGLCGNGKGDTGGCYSDLYLYSTGKFIKDVGFVNYDSEKEVNPAIEMNFTTVIVEQIINKIKDSGVMEKNCPSQQIMDAGWDYQVTINGVKKSFHNTSRDCQDIFDQVDNLLNSFLDYRE
jgi:hypothetical protein